MSIERDLGIPCPVSLLADTSTPRLLAAALKMGAKAPPASSIAIDSRPPIFAVHGMQGFMLPRKDFMLGLHPEQELHMFELPGIRDKTTRLKSVEAIAERYCQQMTEKCPVGPLHLAGFCMGAFIAIEMAARLADLGRPVSKLVLIEPNVPSMLGDLYRKGQWDNAGAIAAYGSESRRAAGDAYTRRLLLRQKENGGDHLQKRYPGYEFSIDARAKLLGAFHTYHPRLLSSPVHVILSKDRQLILKELVDLSVPSVWDKFIPNRKIHIAGESHTAVLDSSSGKTAALIQKIFDGQDPTEM